MNSIKYIIEIHRRRVPRPNLQGGCRWIQWTNAYTIRGARNAVRDILRNDALAHRPQDVRIVEETTVTTRKILKTK